VIIRVEYSLGKTNRIPLFEGIKESVKILIKWVLNEAANSVVEFTKCRYRYSLLRLLFTIGGIR